MAKYGLICMTFDGDHVTEKRAEFDSVDEAWEYAGEMGSRWYFYPFVFVTTESGLSVKDSPDSLKFLNGKRVKSIAKLFKAVAELPESHGADCDLFVVNVRDYCHA